MSFLVTNPQIKEILRLAQEQGHSLEAGSPLEDMTIEQAAKLVGYELAGKN